MAPQKSLKKNALLNALRTLMSLIFPLITFPYASRILNPDGIGKVNFARSIVSYFGMLAALGIGTYGVKTAAKLRDDRQQLSQFVQEIFTINLISTSIAYLLFFITLFSIPRLASYRSLLCVCSATILFTTMGMDWLYSAVEDYAYITIRSIAFQIVSVILLFLLVRNPDDYVQYAAISVVSNVGSNILNFFHSRKYITLKRTVKLHLKKHIRSIFIFFGMAVTISVYTVLDTTMLGFFAGDYQVGLYTASTKINRIVLSLVSSVSGVLLPRLAYYVGQNDKTSFDNSVYKSVDILFLISLPCTIGLSLVAEPAILLFSGEQFKDAIPVMRMMNPIIVIIGLGVLLGGQILIPMNKEKYTLFSEIIGAISNFSLNLVLIPQYNAMGAAIATLAAESLVTSTQLFFARKYFDLKKFLRPFLRYFATACIMGGCVYFIAMHITNIPAKLFIPTICGALIYFVLLLIERNAFVMQYVNTIRAKVLRNA